MQRLLYVDYRENVNIVYVYVSLKNSENVIRNIKAKIHASLK